MSIRNSLCRAKTFIKKILHFLRRARLGCALAFGRAEGAFILLTRHLFLSAQARLENVTGYCHPSLAGLEDSG
jgi:hypothetical protein